MEEKDLEKLTSFLKWRESTNKQFKEEFKKLKNLMRIFNARCSCKDDVVKIIFKQEFNTNEDMLDNWSVTIESELLGNKSIKGNYSLVITETYLYLLELNNQFLDMIWYSRHEWFSNKPEIMAEIEKLKEVILEL